MVDDTIIEYNQQLRSIIENDESIMDHSIKIKIQPESCTIIKKIFNDNYFITIFCKDCNRSQTIVLPLLKEDQIKVFVKKLLYQMNYFKDNYCSCGKENNKEKI